ncbi:MAG TPA: hypothetical protein VGO75_10495 [Gemmatimonadaceae bacterium]|nr:hypothetical protein [Gemmatimonadaceae bacterium]
MRRFLLAVLMVVFAAGSLSAQRRQRVFTTSDPNVWVTAGIGGFRANAVNDGVTSSTWDFGNSTNLQYRASLEKGMNNGSSFGVAGSWAHVPFVYSSTAITPIGGGVQCGSCDAHLDLMTLVATFHSGSGIGFHQVLELSGGVVAYRNLKRDSDGAKLAPSGGNIDPLFSLGWGLGYGLNDRTNIDFTSDYFTYAIHERTGLSNGVSNTNSMPSIRVALRMGFGNRTVRR